MSSSTALTFLAISTPIFLALAWKKSTSRVPKNSIAENTGKCALITGCSEGSSGAALAYTFHTRGYTVFPTARDVSKIPAIFQNLGGVHILELDTTSQTSINRAVAAVHAVVGDAGLNVLVNSAGVMLSGPVLDVDVDLEGDVCFDTNFWGPLRCVQAFSSLLVRGGKKGNATVVNMGSIIGEIWFAYQPIYAASKAALHTLSESMRLELAPLNVRVLTIVVGAIESNLHNNQPRFQSDSSSYYAPVEKHVKNFVDTVVPHSETTAADLAEQILDDVESGKDGKIWRGKGVWLIWSLKNFMPRSVNDWIFGAMKGLGELRRRRANSGRDGGEEGLKASWSERLESWLLVLA